jgi:hypothetical protein
LEGINSRGRRGGVVGSVFVEAHGAVLEAHEHVEVALNRTKER